MTTAKAARAALRWACAALIALAIYSPGAFTERGHVQEWQVIETTQT